MLLSADVDALWSRLSALVVDAMGLHFPRDRRGDLQRGLAGAAKEFGFDDAAACADWLLSSPLTKERLQVLASHLTVSETYFFRERKTFEALANEMLPELIRARSGRERRLRIWCAACCTGEEAYSLAIALRHAIPDLARWQATVLATDINAHSLRKAAAATYGEWSFRDAPDGLKDRYFHRADDGRYVVIPEIRSLVKFAHLNLVDDVYPALDTDTTAMDVIFCRNALMYFSPAQMARVIGKFHRALHDGGWLAVSPSETSQELFSQFATRNFPGAILYQKSDARASASRSPAAARVDWADFMREVYWPAWPPLEDVQPAEAAWRAEAGQPPAPPEPSSMPAAAAPAANAQAASFYERGCYAEAVDVLLALAGARSLVPCEFSLLARALANQGRLAEALAWCDRWIHADKLDSSGHYLRAVVLLEQGESEAARRSLQHAVYLRHDFVLAHFALGNLARRRGTGSDAARHFRNARDLLTRLRPDDPLEESDGLTAGRLEETIAALSTLEHAR
jgi:chemotaxis protein methyltransferase CheR